MEDYKNNQLFHNVTGTFAEYLLGLFEDVQKQFWVVLVCCWHFALGERCQFFFDNYYEEDTLKTTFRRDIDI